MENENKERPLTSKEQFDAEMNGINTATAEARGDDPDKEDIESLADDAEKVMDEMENREDKRELDKNMGVDKRPIGPPGAFTMTADQFHKMKETKDAKGALESLRKITQSALTEQDQKIMDLLISKHDAGEIEDEVLSELLDEKRSTAKLIVNAMGAIQELQRKLMNEVATSSNNLVKAKGAMEGIDKMLLKRHRKLKIKDSEESKMN